MIGKLKGKITEIDGNVGLLETAGGVYYSLFLTPQLISNNRFDEVLEIYTYLQVRDDALVLFGFETKRKYDFFRLLLSVQGVGPKTAFSVVSFLDEDELFASVRNNQVETFTKVPGLGKKTAMKIILELSSKLKSEFDMKNMVMSEEDKTAVDALVSLGYKSHDAKKILSRLPKALSIEEKIRQALKITK